MFIKERIMEQQCEVDSKEKLVVKAFQEWVGDGLGGFW